MLALADKKATFAYHSATHEQSFESSDWTSKLISTLFEPKFLLGMSELLLFDFFELLILPFCYNCKNRSKIMLPLLQIIKKTWFRIE